jgi:hypothetical protein
MGFVNGQVYEDELIMGMTERECRSALLMLANAVESLTGDDDQDGDIGLNAADTGVGSCVPGHDSCHLAKRPVTTGRCRIAVPLCWADA